MPGFGASLTFDPHFLLLVEKFKPFCCRFQGKSRRHVITCLLVKMF